MPNAYGKMLDKTFLSVDHAEERGFIHRDYIAHCLRWSHIVKYLQEKQRYVEASVLDIGCGKEAPLIKTLYTSRLKPLYYVGVDAGPIVPNIKLPTDGIEFFQNCKITDLTINASFDVIVMLEVLEHMEKLQGIETLKFIKSIMKPETVFFLSTPCYNGKDKAANHVYEWAYNELALEFLSVGLTVKNNWGTFASIRDYDHKLSDFDGLQNIFTILRNYYDVNVLACLFAPLFPKESRNCLWHLEL